MDGVFLEIGYFSDTFGVILLANIGYTAEASGVVADGSVRFICGYKFFGKRCFVYVITL